MATIGQMRETISIKTRTITKDSEGFTSESLSTILTARAYVEGRHGSAVWRNRAAFTDATEAFTIRKPSVDIKNDMVIEWRGTVYEIDSVEDVKGRGMWLEILAKAVTPNG